MRHALRILCINQAIALLILCGLVLLLGWRTLPVLWLQIFLFANGVGFAIPLLGRWLEQQKAYRTATTIGKFVGWAGVVLVGTASGMTLAIIALKWLQPGLRFRVTPVLTASGFALMVAALVSALSLLLAQMKSRIEQKAIEVQKLRELEAQTRLTSLQSKVNPHFLFNTLNTMLNLVHRSPDEVETLILSLSDLYRRVLQLPENGRIAVSEEMELIRRYLEIEQIRLGSRLAFVMDLDPQAASFLIPPLLVEPLVENAVKHGIGVKPSGGTVKIRTQLAEGFLHITVEDDGAGIGSQAGSGGFGIYSIQERLRITYEGRASLSIQATPGQGFRAELRVPRD